MNLEKFLSNIYTDYCELKKNNRDSEALYVLEKLTVQCLNVLGLAYCDSLNNFEKGLNCFENALKIDKGNWSVHNNICHAYSLMERHEESFNAAIKSIESSHGLIYETFYNAGVALNSLNRIPECIKMYEMALEFKPDNPDTNYNYGLAKLRMGMCQEGWDKYENRYLTNQLTGKFKKRFLIPEWDGRKLNGKKLLIYSEQGLGDFIFFSRFIPKLKKFDGKIIVEIQDPIAPILGENLLIDEIIPRSNDLNWPKPPEADYAISVCSLPRILKIDSEDKIPNEPYIFAKKTEKPEYFDDKKFKIGLCWCGNSDHKRDYTRSTSIEQWKSLFELPNVQIFGMVKGVSMTRRWPTGVVNLFKNIEKFPLYNLENKIQNFGDSMHFLSHLDLLITVDTGLAHLSAAMGKKTWILLGDEVDWRWGFKKSTTPWYPSVSLFERNGDWNKVIGDITEKVKLISQN